jgi:hypothetical protein
MEMSIEFYKSLQWSAAAFVCGVILREYAPDGVGKWLGRSGVLVSLFAMSAFGAHAARECSTLIQLVEHKNADSIAALPSVVDFEVETKGGTVISWGRDRPVSVATGRGGRSGARRGLSDRNAATTHDGFNDLPHAEHAAGGIKSSSRDF